MTALLITSPFLLIALALAAIRLHRRRSRARQGVVTLFTDGRQCLAFRNRGRARQSVVIPPASQDMPAWGSCCRNPRSKATLEAWNNRLHPVAK